MNLSFGSLFSGVGGFDLGFFRNDWECKWMVEFEKNAAGVLAHHYPDVPLHCDVEKVDADFLADAHSGVMNSFETLLVQRFRRWVGVLWLSPGQLLQACRGDSSFATASSPSPPGG